MTNIVTATMVLANSAGLHARPSVKLTRLAKSFAGGVEVALSADGPWFDAKSPVKMMRLKAPAGSTLHIRADGADAHAALEAVLALIEARFDEPAGGVHD
jgi:phosphocarrier protein